MSKNSNNILFAGGAVAALLILSAGKKISSDTTAKVISLNSSGYNGKPSKFVEFNYSDTLRANKIYPQVPPVLMLTQSGLESQWGKHAPGYNFFGIKADKGWKGDKQLLKTTEILNKNSGYNFPEVISIEKISSGKYRWIVKDYFRKYNSPFGSYLDYCKFITSGRYKSAFTSNNINDIIRSIARAGYATDPGYANKLINLASLVQKQVNAGFSKAA